MVEASPRTRITASCCIASAAGERLLDRRLLPVRELPLAGSTSRTTPTLPSTRASKRPMRTLGGNVSWNNHSTRRSPDKTRTERPESTPKDVRDHDVLKRSVVLRMREAMGDR